MKHHAPQTKTKTKTATPKTMRADAAKPLPCVLPSDITPAHKALSARNDARLDAWRLAGGAEYGPLEDVSITRVLAVAFDGIESDPVRDLLNAMCGELETLSVAMEAPESEIERLDVGLHLYRLARRAEALAELHARMLERALDHVERLALEAET